MIEVAKRLSFCASEKVGYGHNYQAILGITGDINPETHMILELSKLKAMVSKIINQLDHRQLDTLPQFQGTSVTVQTIAKWILDAACHTISFPVTQSHLIQNQTISGIATPVSNTYQWTLGNLQLSFKRPPHQPKRMITLYQNWSRNSSPSIKAHVRQLWNLLINNAPDMTSLRICLPAKMSQIPYYERHLNFDGIQWWNAIRFSFSATHSLKNPGCSDADNMALFGPCTHDHGHEFDTTIMASPTTSWAVLHRVALQLRAQFHHHNLNQHPLLKPGLPTCENMIAQMGRWVSNDMDLSRLIIWETPYNRFTYVVPTHNS